MASYGAVNNQHHDANSPYGSGDPYYNQSTGYITPAKPSKKGVSNWIKFGIPVAVIVIAGAVVGGILGSRAASKTSSAASSASAAASAQAAIGIFATSTDSEFMVPIYPSTVSIDLCSRCFCSICIEGTYF